MNTHSITIQHSKIHASLENNNVSLEELKGLDIRSNSERTGSLFFILKSEVASYLSETPEEKMRNPGGLYGQKTFIGQTELEELLKEPDSQQIAAALEEGVCEVLAILKENEGRSDRSLSQAAHYALEKSNLDQRALKSVSKNIQIRNGCQVSYDQ